MASQSASSRQTCEKDFSPPDRVFAPRPVLSSFVMSGSTWKQTGHLESFKLVTGSS